MAALGFVGFGEAAFHISNGLLKEGFSDIAAYDVAVNSGGPYKKTLLMRSEAAHVSLCASIEELVAQSNVIVIAVPAKYTADTARQVLQFVSSGTLVVDVTTALPDVKEQQEVLFDAKGALYVDSAMLGALPVYEHRVPMLASGKGAQRWHEMMTPYHMSITVLDGNAGTASRNKLVRSVFMKGLEALLVETFLLAKKCGVEQTILESVSETINKVPFQKTVERLICADLVHSERRSYEVGESIALMQSVGIVPAVTEGTKRRLERTTETGAAKELGGKAPESLEQVFLIWSDKNYR